MSPLYIVPGFGQLGQIRLLCKAFRQRGVGVLVVANPDQALCFSDCSERVVVCDDFFSEDMVVLCLRDYAHELERFVNIPDRIWPAIIGASRRLCLQHEDLHGQLNCRIKPRMRYLLKEAQPVKTELISFEQATRSTIASATTHVGVPFVLKPIWGQACDYVEIVTSESDAYKAVSSAFADLKSDSSLRPYQDGETTWNPSGQVLLEEYVIGREFSAEGFVQHGHSVVLMIQEKHRWSVEGGIRYEVSNLSPTPLLDFQDHSRLCSLLEEAISILELDNTFFHIEFKWDGNRFRIIEVNPRLGGGSVPATLKFWFNIDPLEMEVALQLGYTLPKSYPGRSGFLVGVFVSADLPGVFEGFEGLDWVHKQAEFCFETKYLRRGQFIPPRQGLTFGRDRWMYCYDAFFWCHEIRWAHYLVEQTLNLVTVKTTQQD